MLMLILDAILADDKIKVYCVFSNAMLMARDRAFFMPILETGIPNDLGRIEFILGIDYLYLEEKEKSRVIFDEIDVFLYDHCDQFFRLLVTWPKIVWMTGLTATPFKETEGNYECHYTKNILNFALIRSQIGFQDLQERQQNSALPFSVKSTPELKGKIIEYADR